ncbi:MAG: cyclase family protein [Thermoplasmata archaeon]|nr:cyclase family protein [Thermoplasmata archaeon]
MRRIDISIPLRPAMAAFPGDPPFTVEPVHSLARGDAYHTSRISLGSHAGTHVDPPLHFLPDGAPTDRLDLEVLNGPCTVLDVDKNHPAIQPTDLGTLPPGAVRVLFRTANSERWVQREEFFSDYVALSLPAAEELLRRGVRLVGIDSLSVESDPTGKFPVHHALLRKGVIILEGLRLQDVPPGAYDLECLPLRLQDGDGGPARAVLRTT